MLWLSLFPRAQTFVSRLLYLLAWTVTNVGGPKRSWRLCVLDRCACSLQIRCAPEELRLSLYCFHDPPEPVRCKYNLDHQWQLWRACLSTRREIARAVYPPPATAVWCPSVTVTLLDLLLLGSVSQTMCRGTPVCPWRGWSVPRMFYVLTKPSVCYITSVTELWRVGFCKVGVPRPNLVVIIVCRN